jgi:hypothetical protein
MKKLFFPSLVAVAIACAVLITSCDKDPNDPNSIQGTNKEQSTGTGANPNIGVVTVTGTSTLTNPATQNSSLNVGGSGWSYDACVVTTPTTGSSSLMAHNGSTGVSITFGSAPALGISTYTLTSGAPGSGQARLIVTNAPSQPEGITWYSKSGTLSVTTVTTTNGNQTTTSFNNVQCLQYTFLFPVVTVSGNLTCI